MKKRRDQNRPTKGGLKGTKKGFKTKKSVSSKPIFRHKIIKSISRIELLQFLSRLVFFLLITDHYFAWILRESASLDWQLFISAYSALGQNPSWYICLRNSPTIAFFGHQLGKKPGQTERCLKTFRLLMAYRPNDTKSKLHFSTIGSVFT